MFSVLIPVYNHERYVAQAINSALVDRYVSEVLVVDDGSADASAIILRSFQGNSRVRILENGGVNLGCHARLNQLCGEARNEWLAVLNSDDVFVPHRFQVAHQIIRAEKPDLITGSLVLIDAEGRVIGSKRGAVDPEYAFPPNINEGDLTDTAMLRRLLCQNYVATTSNMIFNRSLFEKIAGFAPYRYIHDWDFAIRAYLRGRVVASSAFLTKYRLHATNTIKESGVLVDSEVLRMICALRADFPGLGDSEPFRSALAGNQHLSGNGQAFFTRHRTMPTIPSRQERPSWQADAFDRRKALASTVYRRATGRPVLRIVPTCIPEPANLPEEGTLYVPSHGRRESESERPKDVSLEIADLLPADDRPAILILSGFFAVGGVERNTVEIIRHLRHRYRFVLVTFEKHTMSVGSLHHQLDELDVPAVDFGHLIEPDAFLDCLEAIVAALKPDRAWIINGATWLVQQAAAVRLLLDHAKIIDQQVYDDRAGWIGSFWNPGILASDRFIAVNSRIKDRFTGTYRIPEQKIDLIYPAIALERVCDVQEKRERRRSLEQSFGLSGEGIRIALIGRLTPQKRVDRFIDLVASHQDGLSPIQFAVIGQGPLEESLRADVARRKLARVDFVNYFERASDIGACIDGLVICSDYEGLPIVLLECMAMGIPFLSTDVGDVSIVQKAYGGGVIVDDWSDSESAFREWLVQLPHLREQLQASRERLLRDFASETLAADYDRLFSA